MIVLLFKIIFCVGVFFMLICISDQLERIYNELEYQRELKEWYRKKKKR